jgi:Cu/Ag efflux protein CusF
VKRFKATIAALSLTLVAPFALADRAPLATHTATGVVKKVETDRGVITLRHEPIASLGWPAMTMPFAVKDKKILAAVKNDQRVEFTFEQAEGGAPVIIAIH